MMHVTSDIRPVIWTGATAIDRIPRLKVPATVAQQVEAYVQEEDLQPGARLPSERELMKVLGVGRSSLREGIRLLEARGIVEVHGGKGTFVALVPTEHHEVRMQFLADKRTALDALKIRRKLETLAVEEAVERATDEDVAAIGQALDALEGARAEGRSNTAEDVAFHRFIYRASKNDVLTEVLTAVKELLLFWDRPLGDPHMFDDTDEFHRPIYEAIRDRDKAAGRRSVKRLLDRIETNIRRKRS